MEIFIVLNVLSYLLLVIVPSDKEFLSSFLCETVKMRFFLFAVRGHLNYLSIILRSKYTHRDGRKAGFEDTMH